MPTISVWADGVITIQPGGKIGLKGSRTYGEEELVSIANNPSLSKQEKLERLNKKSLYVLPEFLSELQRNIR